MASALLATTMLAAGTIIAPGTAHAQEARSYDIPAGPLAVALNRFGEAANVELIYDSALTNGASSPGLEGTYDPAEGLSRLLAGSGITFRQTGARVFTLARAPQAAEGDSSITLGPVRVEGEGRGRGSGTPRPPADTRGTYTVRATNSATKLDLAIKDTPQIVNVITRQRIEDQNLVQVADVMAQQPGVTVQQQGVPGVGRIEYWSRGFSVKNVQFDGVITQGAGNDNFTLWSVFDTAIFDRVELVQGSTGLSSGMGDPSGAVNFIRKRPTEEFLAEGTLSYGSWERLRGTVDVAGPLTKDGRIRGRFVGAYSQGGNWQDRVDYKQGTAYGIVEADATDNLLLTAGLSWTKANVDDAAIFGVSPYGQSSASSQVFFSSASLGRHYNPATQWSEANVELLNPFAKAEWRFADDWRINANYMFSKVTQERLGGVIGQQLYDPVRDIADYSWARLNQHGQLHNADLSVSGKFHLFGREHDVTFGGSLYSGHVNNKKNVTSAGYPSTALGYRRIRISSWNNGDVAMPVTGSEYILGDFPNWTHDPLNFDWSDYGHDEPDNIVYEKQYSIYGGARLRPIDRVQVILGARWHYWKRDYTGYNLDTTRALLTGEYVWDEYPDTSYHIKVSGKITPYAGVIFDITKNITAYVSYTGISRANTGLTEGTSWPRDVDGNPLPPITGNSWEIGAKAGLFDNRLNVQLAGYRMEQKNIAGYLPYNAEDAYYDPLAGVPVMPAEPGNGVISQGIEFSLSGQITDRINVSASYSYLDMKIDYGVGETTPYCAFDGRRGFNCPEHSAKLFATWQVTDRLTIGGGGFWKSATTGVPNNLRPGVIELTSQDGFAVVDAMARYRISSNFSLSANVGNIFDKTYYTTQDMFSGFYGAPRNVIITLTGKY